MHPTLGKYSTLPQNCSNNQDSVFHPAQDQYPVWYFFYGTLADSEFLAHLLGISDPSEMPILRSASIIDGAVKTW